MNKIGIFICYCDFEIASSLDLESITAALQKVQGVSFARGFKGLLDTSDQEVFAQSIKKEGLNGLVVASCSPTFTGRSLRLLWKRTG